MPICILNLFFFPKNRQDVTFRPSCDGVTFCAKHAKFVENIVRNHHCYNRGCCGCRDCLCPAIVRY